MTRVDPQALEGLIKDAGIGERTAQKFRDANVKKDEPAGHGAASEDHSSFGDL